MAAMMNNNRSTQVVNPVFIGGTQRSGTSILRTLIDSNSKIYFPRAEMKFFVRFYDRLKEYEPIKEEENLKRFIRDYGNYRKDISRSRLLDSSEFFDVLRSANGSWHNVYNIIMTELASLENKSRWGEKSPGNEYFTDHILNFYPKAKIICTIRDPRAVVASSRRRYGRGITKPMIRWKIAVRKILYDAQRLPGQSFHIVFYENLVLDLKSTMKRVFDFLETEPTRPLDKLLINTEKWKRGGKTSYKERNSGNGNIVWSHSIRAYQDELSYIQMKMIEAMTRKERNIIGRHRKEPRQYNYSSISRKYSKRLNENRVTYHPKISRIINRFTDKPLTL